MHAMLIGLLMTTSIPAIAADRPNRETDDCSLRTVQCEQLCDRQEGIDRISCKAECRLVESRCRSSHRR